MTHNRLDVQAMSDTLLLPFQLQRTEWTSSMGWFRGNSHKRRVHSRQVRLLGILQASNHHIAKHISQTTTVYMQ